MLRENFNRFWTFYKEGNEKEAIQVTLPHDAMLHEKRMANCKNSWNTGYFPGGLYVYTKTFFSPDEYRYKNVIFEFEGVYMNSEVYINGALAGNCHYGYSNFYVSADKFLNHGKDNEIKVIVHNEGEPNSRWYSGSGIYRNVNLIVGELLHVSCDGVKITTRRIDESASLEIKTSVINNGLETRTFDVVTECFSGDYIVATSTTPSAANASETVTILQEICIENPMLWTVDAPNLYSCKTRIVEGTDVIDEIFETFGIRMLELDAKNGLRINNVETKLRGACIHHDNGVIGATTLEAAEDRRVKILKQAGFNAIRSSHNPMSKALLNACDRHGILVMEEAFDMWFFHKNPHDYATWFDACWEKDIEAMVAKDYNHPCVIMYSIGNEITETAFPEGIECSKKLVDKIHSLDNTRFVTSGINLQLNLMTRMGLGVYHAERETKRKKSTKKNLASNFGGSAWINTMMNAFKPFMDRSLRMPSVDKATKNVFAILDVAGYNYGASRYELDCKKYPMRIICGSETYPPDIARNWRLVKKLPHVIGDFQWTGWDYLGETGVGMWHYGKKCGLYKPYPCLLADVGVIDITGYRTAQACYNEIVWGLRKTPYIGVRPINHAREALTKSVWRGTNAIESWSWDGCDGNPAIVEVFSDADFVELLVNGVSLGQKKTGGKHGYKAIFKTTYQPGELVAVAFDANCNEIGRSVLKTASQQVQLNIVSETETLKTNGADLAYINISLIDENGIIKPLADRTISINVKGEGELLGFGSANPFTEETFNGMEHATYYGRALAAVRSGFTEGMVDVTISADGCETKTISIQVKE